MKPTNEEHVHFLDSMRYTIGSEKWAIEKIEKLLPESILKEIAAVLGRGSDKEGKGVLTCDRSYCYYTYKLIKHLLRGLIGLRDKGRSHFACAAVRVVQMLLKSEEL